MATGDNRTDPAAFLPLTPEWFHILSSLSKGPLDGYAIRQAVKARSDGRIELWPATLFSSIGEIECAGLIEEWEPGDPHDEMARRSYYLTALGRRVLLAEAERLEHADRLARAPRGGGSTP
jgi:DNA-binding PadR family transcriptional regulator